MAIDTYVDTAECAVSTALFVHDIRRKCGTTSGIIVRQLAGQLEGMTTICHAGMQTSRHVSTLAGKHGDVTAGLLDVMLAGQPSGMSV